MRRVVFPLLGMAVAVLSMAAARPQQWHWNLPSGIEPPVVPADNPMTAAKVELGRRLFYDADLSTNGTMSCATCHEQKRAFADGNRTRAGVHGDAGRRNVPGLANVAFAPTLTWADSRLTTLEKQAAVPLFGDHPVEMGMKGMEAELVRRLAKDSCYRTMFRRAFPETEGAIDIPSVTRALAAFERTLISRDSPYDRYLRGERQALSGGALDGRALFAAHCASCHGGPDFTDYRFHALEPAQIAGADPDRGLAEATGKPEDMGRFRTPGLRNVGLTAPYMHDGAATTLDAALHRHAGQVPAVAAMTEWQYAALREFLGALSDDRFVSDPSFAYPSTACGRPL
jgi:cytochrome c peroxidase